MNAAVFAHPQAIVESPNIGSGTRVWAYSHVMSGARIGCNCNIGEQCFIESGVEIGDSVVIKNGVAIWDGITIGNGVFIGPNVVFTNDRIPRAKIFRDHLPIRVHDNASIGANATVICGIEIGAYSMIGAGSVVTRNVPDFALVYGNPARIRGYVCHCGEKLSFRDGDAECSCGNRFALRDGTVAVIYALQASIAVKCHPPAN